MRQRKAAEQKACANVQAHRPINPPAWPAFFRLWRGERRAPKAYEPSRSFIISAHENLTSPNILFLVMSLNLMRALASVTVTAGARETHAEQLPGLAVGNDLCRVRTRGGAGRISGGRRARAGARAKVFMHMLPVRGWWGLLPVGAAAC